MIYFDNAATSQAKCANIPTAIANYLQEVVASPGRGSHRYGQRAAEIIESTKQLLCRIFNGDAAEQFHFCHNATHGLNLVIQGLTNPGDHIVTTALEHNSVLRPLRKMSDEKHAKVTIVPSSSHGVIDPQQVIDAIQPHTKLVVLNHASNVFGTILDILPILSHCQKNNIKTLVDASQTAGLLKINLQEMPATFLVATGHKALNGPSGTGFIFARSTDSISSLLVGGTGGNSASLWHPQNHSSIFEAGTPNYLGVAGLKAALHEHQEISLESRQENLAKELLLTHHIFSQLSACEDIKVYGQWREDKQIPLFIFNFKNMSPQQALHILDERYDIVLRAGLHCAPIAHMMACTLPHGALRVSLGPQNNWSEAKHFLEAIYELAEQTKNQIQAV